MNSRTRIILASAAILLALAVTAYSMDWFARDPVKHLQVQAACPKCNQTTSLTMGEVKARGNHDPERGWFINCPNCGEPASVQIPEAPASE